MNEKNLVTIDEIKDLIRADRIRPSDIFDVAQLRECIRDQEAMARARAEEHEKILAEGEKSIADGKRFQAAMDAIDGKGGDKAEGGDAELDKYLDPKKNPMIKIGD